MKTLEDILNETITEKQAETLLDIYDISKESIAHLESVPSRRRLAFCMLGSGTINLVSYEFKVDRKLAKQGQESLSKNENPKLATKQFMNTSDAPLATPKNQKLRQEKQEEIEI